MNQVENFGQRNKTSYCIFFFFFYFRLQECCGGWGGRRQLKLV